MVAVVRVAVVAVTGILDVRDGLERAGIVLLRQAVVEARKPALHDEQEREDHAEHGMECTGRHWSAGKVARTEAPCKQPSRGRASVIQ